MAFVAPMLAHPLPDTFEVKPGEWVAEEKYDGHRIILEVSDKAADLFTPRTVRAWSRYGRDRILPPHIREAGRNLPNVVLDGELIVPGKRSYGVTELTELDKLQYVIFDVLEIEGVNTYDIEYAERRKFVRMIGGQLDPDGPFSFSVPTPVESWGDVERLRDAMWADGREGLILKRLDSIYEPGKRRKSWVKIKQFQSESVTVMGFTRGRLGPCSIINVMDNAGIQFTVKVLNMSELARIEANPDLWIGKQLRIEYQEKTPDGSYRHPRWDRWEDE